MPSSTSIPIIVQGNSFSLAIPLQIYVISEGSMVLQDYTPDPTDQVSIQLKGSRRQYTYTPTIQGNTAFIDLSGNEMADNYGVVVSIVKENGQRLRSFRTDQFFIVESSDDLTPADIIQGLEENVIYLNSQAFVAGADGRGIESIVKTSTSGLVDTYTITYTDATTSTFEVTNGAQGQQGEDGVGITSITKTSTSGLVDTYTILLSNGESTTFDVTNGMNGVDLGEANIVDNLTTGGSANVLSAEMGKVLNGKVSIEEQSSWGDTTGSSSAYGQYMWPFFKPISQACTVTKLYVNETYASSLASNTSIKLFVAELNAEKTVYSITRLVTATLLAGESSVDLNIDLPANSSLYIEFVYPASQQSFCLARPDLSDDDAYPQQLVQIGYVSVGTNINVSGTSKRAWGLKFDYTITGSLKDVVEQNTQRIEALEDKADDRLVSYKRPTTLLALGSSLTDVHESYKGGGWLDILNDMVDVVIINDGQSGETRQGNFQKLINYGIIHDEENFAKKINPTYIFCANTANMAGTDAVGIGAQADLEYGLNISRLLGSQLIFGTELPMYHNSKEFDQTYSSFCRKHNLLVSPYCRIASLLKVDTPYYGFSQGNGSNVHGGYRCKSYALAHYDLLKILPIKKSIKFFEPRPDYQGGSPTYTQLIYENNEERFVKFHALKTGEGAWVGTKGVDNLDNSDYDTSTGTDGGHEGGNGNASSYTSFMQRGASVSFNKFALCEVILDRINCTKGTLTFDCSVNPSAIYVATRKTTFATPMSEWTLLTHTTDNGVVSVNIERSEKDFMLYDKVRILICSSGSFTIAKPSFSGYDGDLKPDTEPLRDYHIRQYGAELLAKTSCEDGWTMGGNASVQSLPTEIANYSGYNSVKSHIELASDSDYCSKSVAITQPCSKVAVRVVANLYPKIATSRTFGQMTDAQKAKYISTTPTIAEFGYNFGTLRVSFGNGAVKDFTMWCGWCEYYQEVDVAPTDTSMTLKIERMIAKDGITTNSDFNVFVHDVSVQKIG